MKTLIISYEISFGSSLIQSLTNTINLWPNPPNLLPKVWYSTRLQLLIISNFGHQTGRIRPQIDGILTMLSQSSFNAGSILYNLLSHNVVAHCVFTNRIGKISSNCSPILWKYQLCRTWLTERGMRCKVRGPPPNRGGSRCASWCHPRVSLHLTFCTSAVSFCPSLQIFF